MAVLGGGKMKVLLLGANGYMGPHVVKAIAPYHHLRITDILPPPAEIKEQYKNHEFLTVDITSADQVLRAAEGMDAIINLSVVRRDRVLAFQVNALGCWHMMRAAEKHGIRRVINTGPHFTIAGPTYESFDFAISPDVPPHPGTGLYPLSKSLGQEICRLFTEHHEIHVLEYLFYILRDPSELRPASGGRPFMISWADAAEAFRLGLDIELEKLPSRCEVFFLFDDLPQDAFRNDKAKRILGFQPKDDVTVLWRKRK
jgi:hypothetical protein